MVSGKIRKLFEAYSPGLFEEIKRRIEKSEKDYDGNCGDSSLWEHTLHVTSIAISIAGEENVELIPVIITALFHDSGKFIGGEYHNLDIPEEEDSISIAEEILNKFMVEERLIRTVTGSLRSLYNEKAKKDKISNIIHDADFLSKSGPLGIAVYFTKSVLRKKNIINWLTESASKEITYANYLPENMFTEAGKKLAENDKDYTVK
ncbi:MAG: HD domain-containing protein, partial [Acidobacteriota bacterium]